MRLTLPLSKGTVRHNITKMVTVDENWLAVLIHRPSTFLRTLLLYYKAQLLNVLGKTVTHLHLNWN